MGVSLKKNKADSYFHLFFRETHFHSVTSRAQAVVKIYYHCIIFLLPFMAIVCVMANLLLNWQKMP